MSLMSGADLLKAKARQDGASEVDILRSALLEIADQHKRQQSEIINALNRLESSVKASNTEKEQNYTEALKNASDTVLGDVKKEMTTFKAEIQEAVKALEGAKKKKKESDIRQTLTEFAVLIALIFVAFYVALLCYGWWYDIPEAVKCVTNHNTMLEAINNGIYQLLNK